MLLCKLLVKNIFFPERRTFFLENADLFAGYGTGDVRPFYSRTIGLDPNLNRIPIIGGARLSGNINKSTRIGLMNMQTGKKDGYAAQNYTAATVNKSVLKRSVIKAYFLNRQGFLPAGERSKNPLDAYGRNAGTEFNYNDIQGKWGGWASYHHSFKPGISKDNSYINAGGNYNGRNFSAYINASNVGTNYYTDMGYVARIENYDAEKDTTVRLGYKDLITDISYRIYPKGGKIGQHNFDISHYQVLNPDNSVNEQNTQLNYFIQFLNTGNLFFNATNNKVNLLFPTSFTDAKPLPRGNYSYNKFRVGYFSDFRKVFSFNINAGSGQFYNGTYNTVSAGINLHRQPHVNAGVNAEYNKLIFPAGYGSRELFLLSSRVEINFTTALFWTTFLQYNTQRNNFNINSRFQYRFRPMSDLFLVYTDNYFTNPLFKNKNRAIVFKLNYWLNL